MREGLSQTVNIACMPSVTGSYTGGYTGGIITFMDTYWDIIICKWHINGVDHYDTQTQATTDCTKIGYWLWSTGWIQYYRITPTNDQAMITKYIDSSVCGR